MNYSIEKVNFLIKDFNIHSTNIINSVLELYIEPDNTTTEKLLSSFKIVNYLGKGTIGQVYLIESNQQKYVIKISNSSCQNDLNNEVKLISSYFERGKIVHKAYPLYYGNFINLNAFGIIYQYFGFYNLEKIKTINYKITFEYNKSIIKQLIVQLINFTTVIHGDLKPSNVVVDILNNQIFATIIDFGLIKEKTNVNGLISTNYITSPESLLTLDYYNEYLNPIDNIDFSKHDYYGLVCIVINLFVKNSFWTIISNYISNCLKIEKTILMNHESIDIFIYIWYRFYYVSIDDLPNKSFKNLIHHIEKKHKGIKNKNYYMFEEFFENYIINNIDSSTINIKYIYLLMDLLKQISHFDPDKRTELSELMFHNFFN